MSCVELIERLHEALRAEDRGGSVEETGLAIEAIEAALIAAELEDPEPVRIVGPAINLDEVITEARIYNPDGWRQEVAEHLAGEVEPEIEAICPGCDTSEFQSAWRLWSKAPANVAVEGALAVGRALADISEVVWDSVHSERFECSNCCTALQITDAEELPSRRSGPGRAQEEISAAAAAHHHGPGLLGRGAG